MVGSLENINGQAAVGGLTRPAHVVQLAGLTSHFHLSTENSKKMGVGPGVSSRVQLV